MYAWILLLWAFVTLFRVSDSIFFFFFLWLRILSAILLMIIALIMKLVWNWNEEDRNVEVRVSETSGLLSHKEEEASFISYGTHEEDLESSGGRSCSSTSEDLYDGKICVICYDDQRSCFFTPCGHCITCYTCAKR